jgi:hypothetical protein
LLLDAGADVNAGNQSGMPPLHLALHHDRLEVARQLIKYGADPNKRGSLFGGTALHHAVIAAVRCSDFDVFEAVLNAGAEINAPDQRGRTPLDLIANGNNLDYVFPSDRRMWKKIHKNIDDMVDRLEALGGVTPQTDAERAYLESEQSKKDKTELREMCNVFNRASRNK